MTAPYLRDLERWRELAQLCRDDAPIDDIRAQARRMKEIIMPRSEWDNPKSPFVLLINCARRAMPSGRPQLKDLAGRCLVILGAAPPAPTETTEQAWQRRADIGD